MDFDPTKSDDVKKLQGLLNKFNSLSGHPVKPLPASGQMDPATQSAWLAFKREEFADGQISLGYLKDRLGEEKFASLGLDPDPRKFNRDAPPPQAVEALREHLGIPADAAYGSKAFSEAVKKDKREHWIDGRTNKGALQDLEKKTESRQQDRVELTELTAGAKALGKGDAGTGVALLQAFLASEKGGGHTLAVDGVFDDKTKAALIDYQQQVNVQRKREGGQRIDTDGVLGMESFVAMKADGFDLKATQDDLAQRVSQDAEKGGHLGEKLERADRMRAHVLEAKKLYDRAGGSGAQDASQTPAQTVGGKGGKGQEAER